MFRGKVELLSVKFLVSCELCLVVRTFKIPGDVDSSVVCC